MLLLVIILSWVNRFLLRIYNNFPTILLMELVKTHNFACAVLCSLSFSLHGHLHLLIHHKFNRIFTQLLTLPHFGCPMCLSWLLTILLSREAWYCALTGGWLESIRIQSSIDQLVCKPWWLYRVLLDLTLLPEFTFIKDWRAASLTA